MDVTVGDQHQPVTSDWPAAEHFLGEHPNRWGSLSWISARSLIDSVNDVLSRASDGLIDQLRDAWVDRTGPDDLRIIDRPDDHRFLIIGDTGEQDPSQYVVSPELARIANDPTAPCDFVLIMSDVIYPAGDVDDYRDGVYRPYRTTGYDEKFLIKPPILALPGNHDWYDGLSGFMYHFCHQPQLPASAYAPTRHTNLLGRLFRVLWRFPSPARPETESLRSRRPLTTSLVTGETIEQPGPYFAVRTRDLLLVCIDTGIGGNVGQRQWDWLKTISALDGDKVLITGKPLVVNGRIVPGHIGHRSAGSDQPSVWRDIVLEPSHRYVATVGGDTHNYQKYARREDHPDEQGGPQWHLVSGGGGAYTHATHSYAVADLDSRLKRSTDKPYYGLPEASFPEQRTSISFFAELLVPSVWRILRFLLLIILGVAPVVIAALSDRQWVTALTGDAAILGLLGIGLIRAAGSRRPRESPFARFLTGAAGVLLGALVGSVGYWLDPAHFLRFFVFWVLLTGYACVYGGALRRSGWWRPAADFRRVVPPAAFFAGLIGLSVIGAALAYAAFPGDGWRGPVVAALIPLVVGSLGWFLRRVDRLTRFWGRAGTVVAPLIQLGVAVVVLVQLSRFVGKPWLVGGAVVGLVVTIVLLVGTGLAVLLVTEILALLPAAPIAWLITGRRAGSWRRGWGAIAHGTHHLPSLLLLAGTVGWIGWWTDGSSYRQAGSGLPVLIFAAAALMLFVGLLRRKLRTAYLIPIVAALAVAALVTAVQITGWYDLARLWPAGVGYLRTDWAPRVVLGTAVIIIALLVSAVLAHLAFLNALVLLIRPAYRSGPYFADEDEAARFLTARRQPVVERPADVSLKAWTGGRITSPGLGEAGGPLQDKVSEVYSSDVPPFHKNFLTLDTEPGRLRIDVHRIAVPEATPTSGLG